MSWPSTPNGVARVTDRPYRGIRGPGRPDPLAPAGGRWRGVGRGTATTLAAEMPVSRPAVIKHLRGARSRGFGRTAAGRTRGHLRDPHRAAAGDGGLDGRARIGLGHEAGRVEAAGGTSERRSPMQRESTNEMNLPPIVSPQEWKAAREELLVKEKELTHAPRRARRRAPADAEDAKSRRTRSSRVPDGRARLAGPLRGPPSADRLPLLLRARSGGLARRWVPRLLQAHGSDHPPGPPERP